jgi:type VI secretion system protein ImpF
MAELTSLERLQPSLLDRLSDDDTAQVFEPRDKRVLSMRRLRKAVLRDLGWLLNSTSLGSFRDLRKCPLAGQSVLNFGLPDLAGKTAAGLDSSGATLSPNQMTFEIHGELWGQPLPERLYLKTELDLEAGEARIFDIETRDVR